MKRKMPKPEQHRTDGKFDAEKFIAESPDAYEAFMSGETACPKITIEAGEGGVLHVVAEHHHQAPGQPKPKNGMSPAAAVVLSKLLVDMIKAGALVPTAAGDRERPHPTKGGHTLWEMDFTVDESKVPAAEEPASDQ